MSDSAANSCENAITHNQLVIENPASDYAMVPGAIAGSSCTQQYGNTPVVPRSLPVAPRRHPRREAR